MKKVIFEQPENTISIEGLKEVNFFIGVMMQKTKGMLVNDYNGYFPVTADLTIVPNEFHFNLAVISLNEGLKIFDQVYQFDSLIELVTWLTSE